MKDRIRKIMENEQLTPSAFADTLQVGRAVISHILNGRNNPSLDIVTRILSKMSYINPDWLLTGQGEMYKSDFVGNQPTISHNISAQEPDLFSQPFINQADKVENDKYRKEIIVEQAEIKLQNNDNKQVICENKPERKINKIIIYYSDNTFETFNPDKHSL
jgi:transcriptional regulator with XRE-family HTH domain